MDLPVFVMRLCAVMDLPVHVMRMDLPVHVMRMDQPVHVRRIDLLFTS